MSEKTDPKTPRPVPLVIERGRWIRGAFSGDYEARASAQASVVHGARVLPMHIVRGVLRDVVPADDAPAVGDGVFAQDRVQPVFVDFGPDPVAGTSRIHNMCLREARLVSWRAEPLIDEGAVARGHVHGTLYARVGPKPWNLRWLLWLLPLLCLCVGLPWACPSCGVGCAQALDPLAGIGCGPPHAGAGAQTDARGGTGVGDGDTNTATDVGAGGAGIAAGGTGSGNAVPSPGEREPVDPSNHARVAPAAGDDDAPVGAGARLSVDEALRDPKGLASQCNQPLSLPSDVLFALNDDALRADALPIMQQVRQLLTDAKAQKLDVRVSGHTDPSGTEAHNQALSDRRARRVARWLVDNDAVAAAHVSAVGRGERELVVPADAPQPRQRYNRRVEISVRCPRKSP